MATNTNIYGVQMQPVGSGGTTVHSIVSGQPVGGTYRGLGAEWFNARNVAIEDWQRAEQSANNEFYRALGLQQDAQGFNASEAQKQRDFEKMMSDTAYQRAMQDMQKAGINPILAYSQGGASTPQGASASSGAGSSSGSNAPRGSGSQTGSLLGSIISLTNGLVNYKSNKYSADSAQMTNRERLDYMRSHDVEKTKRSEIKALERTADAYVRATKLHADDDALSLLMSAVTKYLKYL